MVDLVKELCEKEKTIAAERDRIEHSRVSSEDARSKCRSMAAAVVKLRKELERAHKGTITAQSKLRGTCDKHRALMQIVLQVHQSYLRSCINAR